MFATPLAKPCQTITNGATMEVTCEGGLGTIGWSTVKGGGLTLISFYRLIKNTSVSFKRDIGFIHNVVIASMNVRTLDVILYEVFLGQKLIKN